MLEKNVVFLTGTLCTEECFRVQKNHLSDFANITIDTLNRGNSVEELATLILDDLPQQFSLVGFSMGGVIAFEMQRQAPERVQSMVLMNVNPAATSNKQLQTWDSWTSKLDKGGFPEIIHDFKDSIVQDACRRTIWDMAQQQGTDCLQRQLQILKTRKDSQPTLSDISCPTLLLCGREDRLTPVSVHYEMHQKIVDSSFVSLANCGHYSPLEQPVKVSNLLKDFFLDNT